eukprot:9287996-Pyramimonas_sp.AAC.1
MDAAHFSRGPTTSAAVAAQVTTAEQAGATEQQSAAAGTELNPQPTVVQKIHDRGGLRSGRPGLWHDGVQARGRAQHTPEHVRGAQGGDQVRRDGTPHPSQAEGAGGDHARAHERQELEPARRS